MSWMNGTSIESALTYYVGWDCVPIEWHSDYHIKEWLVHVISHQSLQATSSTIMHEH